MNEGKDKKGERGIEGKEHIGDREVERRVFKLGTKRDIIARWTRQGAGQDKEKSNDDGTSRRTNWQIYGTWRSPPKLEIYRADSYKSETARRAKRPRARSKTSAP